MSIHIHANMGDIAETVLMPGDPLRAKFIAENYLDQAVCYNEVRGMYGFTGLYKGKKVSVQGSGMGVPSISIYANELISQFGAKRLVRVGTCGSLQESVRIRDVILAMSASTDSAINRLRFHGMDYAPTADFSLLKKAYDVAMEKSLPVKVGSVFTSDTFYDDDPEAWRLWARFGVLAVEMETAALYTLAAKFQIQALAILTVSDFLPGKEAASPEDRQTGFMKMVELALDSVL